MLDVTEVINKFGFPIVMAVGMGYFIYYIWKFVTTEIKAQTESEKVSGGAAIKTQNNVLINSEVPFGQGNYGALMEKLLKSE